MDNNKHITQINVDPNIDMSVFKNGIVDFVKQQDNKSLKEDEEHTIAEGDKNKDIRYDPNMNRKEIDKATRENQKR